MVRSGLRLCAAALTLSALALGLPGASATATEAADGVTAGTLLPSRQQTELPPFWLDAVSPHHVAYTYNQPSAVTRDVITIQRLADGSVVRTLPRQTSYYRNQIAFSGQSYLWWVDEGVAHVRWVEAYDVESGERAYRMTFAPDDYLIKAGEGWALVRRGSLTGTGELHLLRQDGTDMPIAGHWADSNTGVRVLDENTVLVRNGFWPLWSLDLTTGATTKLLDDVSWTGDLMVTPSRMYWTTRSGLDNKVIHWRDRSDGSTGSLPYSGPFVHDFIAYGDRVAARYNPPGTTIYRQELLPVDLATGNVEAPVAAEIAAMAATGDGQVVSVLSDTPTGRVAIVTDGAPLREVAALPPRALPVGQVASSEGVVAASFWEDDQWPGPVYRTSVDGTGTWTEVPGSDDPADDSWSHEPFAYAGGVTLRRLHTVSSGVDRYRLTWPGGSRELTTSYNVISLGRGGKLLIRVNPDAPAGAAKEIQEARSGAVLATHPTGQGADSGLVLDGSWIWRSTATGTIRGIDTSASQAERVIESGLTCMSLRAVAGRWALASACGYGGSAAGTFVVDLWDVLDPWRLPLDSKDGEPVLGQGFVVWSRFRGEVADPQNVLVVTDLAPGHATRLHGPFLGYRYPPNASYTVDAASPALIYLDAESQVRRTGIDWLTAAPVGPKRPTPTPTPAPTSTPTPTPVATPTPAPSVTPEVGPGGTGVRGRLRTAAILSTSRRSQIRYEVQPTAVAGATSFEIAYREAAPGQGFGIWTTPGSWARSTGGVVSRWVRAGGELCFRVRGIDRAGQPGPWTAASCSSVPFGSAGLRPFGPINERAMVVQGSDRRAIDGSISLLQKSGASVRSEVVTGRQVALWVIRGPKQGKVDVFVGNQKVGRINLAADRWSRQLVILNKGKPWKGRIVVRSVNGKEGRIDALALLR